MRRLSRFGLSASTTLKPEPARRAVRPAPNEHVPSMPTTRHFPGAPMASAESRYPAAVAGNAPSRTFLPKASITQSTCTSLWVSTPAATNEASASMRTPQAAIENDTHLMAASDEPHQEARPESNLIPNRDDQLTLANLADVVIASVAAAIQVEQQHELVVHVQLPLLTEL